MSDNAVVDRRVERTQAALWQALFSLLHELAWQDINVSTICRRANVARSSFYLHFQNKQELLDFGFETGMQAARVEISGYGSNVDGFACLHWLVHHVHSVNGFENSKFVEDSHIFARFQRAFAGLFMEEIARRKVAVDEHVLAFTVGGVFSVLQVWAISGVGLPPQSVVDNLNEMVSGLMPDT